MFWGEHATAYYVKNRGLVIISSCGHAGIINSIAFWYFLSQNDYP
jgi:metal-dependent hydrolase (beta-lactamase superfamily II)